MLQILFLTLPFFGHGILPSSKTNNLCSVSSLHCYVSDFESLQFKNDKVNSTLQNCINYNSAVKYLSQELQVPENGSTHCYSLEVSRDTHLKGCVQKGGCKFLVHKIRSILVQFQHFESVLDRMGKVECMECNSNKCNLNNAGYQKFVPTTPAPQELRRESTSLKCYYCLESCEISTARQKICGQHIGNTHEAVCSTETFKNTSENALAIRKCQVVPKNQPPSCSENSVCTFCKTDLCNGELPSVTSDGAIFLNANLLVAMWSTCVLNLIALYI